MHFLAALLTNLDTHLIEWQSRSEIWLAQIMIRISSSRWLRSICFLALGRNKNKNRKGIIGANM
jgi:hypothetical protein